MNRIITEDLQKIISCNLSWDTLREKVVLVTGATGMIPSYMLFTLAYMNDHIPDANIQLLAVGRDEKKAQRLFRVLMDKPYFRFIQADLMKGFQCEEHVDYIVHGASHASTQYFCTDPAGTFLPNVLGTHDLLKIAQRDQAKGFLFLSSGEVYGQITGQVITEETSGAVDPLKLRNSYAEGKRAGEMLCSIWNAQYKVPTKIARLSHTFGPTMDFTKDGRVFAEFIRNVLEGKDIVMKSDGSAVRPFCYLSDATTALFQILLEGAAGEAYNVCNHEGYLSILELAELLAGLYPEKGLRVVRQARSSEDAYKESLAMNCITDNEKLRSLGWAPKITVAEGFRRTINSYWLERGNDEHTAIK